MCPRTQLMADISSKQKDLSAAALHSRRTKCPGDASIAALEKAGGRREHRMLIAPAARIKKIPPQVRQNAGPPCALFSVLYALSPESRFVPPPRPPMTSADLIPASGDQDHATSLVRGPPRSS